MPYTSSEDSQYSPTLAVVFFMIPHGGYVQISVLKSVKVIYPKIYNEMWSIEG